MLAIYTQCRQKGGLDDDDEEYTGLVAVTTGAGGLTYLIFVVAPKLAPQTAPIFILEIHGFGGLGVEYTPPIQG